MTTITFIISKTSFRYLDTYTFIPPKLPKVGVQLFGDRFIRELAINLLPNHKTGASPDRYWRYVSLQEAGIAIAALGRF